MVCLKIIKITNMKQFNVQSIACKVINVFVFIVIIFAVSDIKSQTNGWNYIGNSNISGSTANFQNLMLRGNVPYVIYQDWSQSGRKATVKKWTGTAWTTVGSAGITDNYPYYMSMSASSDSLIYFAYLGTSGIVKVMKYDGTSWTTVGANLTTAGGYWTNLQCDDAVPVVAYQDQSVSNKLFVKKWNGTSWINVPSSVTTGISDGAADYIDMHISGDHNIYVAYKDGSASSKATVKKFNGTSWSTLGTTGFTTAKASMLKMALYQNTPYVAYYTSVSDGGANKISVQKWNGTSWEFVGAENFTLEMYYDFDIACGPDGVPYLTYDNNSNNKQRLLKFDGSNWVTIGAADGYTGYSASYPSLKIAPDNVPVVAFMDGNSSPQYTTSVMWYKTPVVLSDPPYQQTGVSFSPAMKWFTAPYSKYYLEVSANGSFNPKVFSDSTITDTLKSISGLAGNTYYYWRVRGVHFYGYSTPQSTLWYFKTAPPAPPAPVLISPSNGSTSTPLTFWMYWNTASGANTYKIQIATDTIFSFLALDSTISSTSIYVPSGKLTNGVKYYWRACGINEAGQGAWSTFWNFTTILPAPAAPTLVSPLNNSLDLSVTPSLNWSSVSFAASYRIQVSAFPTFTSVFYDSSGNTGTGVIIPPGRLTTNMLYYWRVNAVNTSGTSSWSSVWNFTTAPNVPNVPVLSFPANNSTGLPLNTTFKWYKSIETLGDSPDAISKYWFEYSTDSTFTAGVLIDTTLTDTLKSITGLSNITKYCWRVKAKNQTGWGSFSTVWNFTTIVPVPSTPTLISPLNGATGIPLSLYLQWNKPQYASGYNVLIATDEVFTNIVINDSTLTDTLKSLSNLNPLTTYYWKVRAKNNSGWSTFSSANYFKTIGVPGQITLSSPANNSVSQPVNLSFTWFKAVNQTYDPNITSFSYWFEIATDAGFANIVTKDTLLTDTVKSVAGLFNATDYYWRVKGKGTVGWGVFSAGWKFTTIVPIPAAPILVSPLNNSMNNLLNLNLVWNKPSYSTLFNVVVSTNISFTNIILNDSTLTDSVKAISGLLNGTTYYWKVRAKNIAGWGSFSNVFNFTTLGIPSTVVLASPSNNATNQFTNITFKWFKANDNVPVNDPKAITNYWFDVASDSLFANIITRDSSLTDTTKYVTGLSYITNYFWRVKAKNPTGWGVFSSVWKLTTVPPVPVEPVLLTPANNSEDLSVTPALDWNEVTYASSYRVQISTSASFTTTVYDTAGLNSSSIIVPSGKLTTNTQYYWRVSATNISGTSSYSVVWNFTTSPNAPNVPLLSQPANSATGQPTTITFKWYKAIETFGDSPDEISKYWFEHSTDSTFANVIARDSSLTDTTKTLSGLNNITKYFWRVKAKNQTGWGNFSSIWNFTTIVPLPVAPVLSLPLNNTTGVVLSPVLTWNSVSFAVSYRIQVSVDSNFTTTQWDTSGVTGINATVPAGKLTGLTKYYWRVNAVNENGTGNWSSVWNFRTLQNLPLNLKVYLEGFWNGTTQVTDSVTVYLANASAPFARVDSARVVLSPTGTSAVNFSKAPNGNYYLVVNHRNHLETWSKLAQSFSTNNAVNYDFTTAATQAFGDNMKQIGSIWVLYGGDANRDGSIDAMDIAIFTQEFGNLGYLRSDFNGDEDVNALDILIISQNFGLIKIIPGVEPLLPGTIKNIQNQFNINLKSDKSSIKNNKIKANN